MKRAKALGGPLDGVKLTAPLSWDGLIPKNFDGYYLWDYDRDGWVWELGRRVMFDDWLFADLRA